MAERIGRAGEVLWLLAVWLVLWGRVTPVIVLGGFAVAVALVQGVRLPQVRLRLRPRPGLLLVELGRLASDIGRSTGLLAWAVMTSGPSTRSSVVRVPVRASDPGLAVLVATWVSITPGSLVLQLDPDGREMVVHMAPAKDPDTVRHEVVDLQRRLLRALGGEES